jgi:hypothetical protein
MNAPSLQEGVHTLPLQLSLFLLTLNVQDFITYAILIYTLLTYRMRLFDIAHVVEIMASIAGHARPQIQRRVCHHAECARDGKLIITH